MDPKKFHYFFQLNSVFGSIKNKFRTFCVKKGHKIEKKTLYRFSVRIWSEVRLKQ